MKIEDKNIAPDIPDVKLVGEASSSLNEKELALVGKMVVEIGGNGERFLTKDVKSDSGLMETLNKLPMNVTIFSP